MRGPIRGDEYALEGEDVQVFRSADGEVLMVPRSMRDAPPERKRAVTSLMRAAAAYEEAFAVLSEGVAEARDLGVSWDGIGWAVGTTGSAARKRWGVDQ